MSAVDRVQFSTGAAVGADGVATATGYSTPIAGEVLAVHVAYLDTPPAATTDFTLQDESDPAAENIVNLVNAATNAKHYVRRITAASTGFGITYNGTQPVYEPYVVCGRLKATIAQANAGDSVTVTVWYRR